MPNEGIHPELFLEYKGVAVYHTYRHNQMVSAYWYTTDPLDCDYTLPTSEAQFDIRQLPNWGCDSNDPRNHVPIIENAIQERLINGQPAVKTEVPLLVVRIEVHEGVASVINKPPGVAVEITYYDH